MLWLDAEDVMVVGTPLVELFMVWGSVNANGTRNGSVDEVE